MPKGYYVPTGYMGFVINSYQLFATESEYLEYVSWSPTGMDSNVLTYPKEHTWNVYTLIKYIYYHISCKLSILAVCSQV